MIVSHRTAPSRRALRVSSIGAALCTAAFVAGCASTPPAPVAQIESARQAVADAERAQAAQHAAPELSQARSKLAAADAAVNKEDMAQAARLAEEARVDAILASARTAAAKSESANEEIRRANRSLLDEMGRRTPGGTP